MGNPAVIVQLVLVAASAAAAIYMSGQLSKKLDDKLGGSGSLADDEGPVTNTNQGAFVPYVIGRARVGVLYGWTGSRKANPGPGGAPSAAAQQALQKSP